jgi:hypothetical protein
MSVVVVVLPLLPVMATIGEEQNQLLTSNSEHTRMPRFNASRTDGASLGTPGLMTITSQPKMRSVCASVSNPMPAASNSAIACASDDAGDLSLTKTRAPFAFRSFATAIPLLAAPMTVTDVPSTRFMTRYRTLNVDRLRIISRIAMM